MAAAAPIDGQGPIIAVIIWTNASFSSHSHLQEQTVSQLVSHSVRSLVSMVMYVLTVVKVENTVGIIPERGNGRSHPWHPMKPDDDAVCWILRISPGAKRTQAKKKEFLLKWNDSREFDFILPLVGGWRKEKNSSLDDYDAQNSVAIHQSKQDNYIIIIISSASGAEWGRANRWTEQDDEGWDGIIGVNYRQYYRNGEEIKRWRSWKRFLVG